MFIAATNSKRCVCAPAARLGDARLKLYPGCDEKADRCDLKVEDLPAKQTLEPRPARLEALVRAAKEGAGATPLALCRGVGLYHLIIVHGLYPDRWSRGTRECHLPS